MSDEELEQDDLDVSEEDEGECEALNAADEGDEGEDSGSDVAERTPSKKAKAAEPEELPSVEAKERERAELERAMAEFLARGGRVQEIEPNVVADPPRKPDSKYGSRPI